MADIDSIKTTTENEEQELFENYRFVVDKGQETMRLDKYLQMRIEGVSRTKVQAAAKASCVIVNDKPAKSNYKIKPLDVISVLLPTPPREIEILPENIPFNIVYEDDDVDLWFIQAMATLQALCLMLWPTTMRARKAKTGSRLLLSWFTESTKTLPDYC